MSHYHFATLFWADSSDYIVFCNIVWQSQENQNHRRCRIVNIRLSPERGKVEA